MRWNLKEAVSKPLVRWTEITYTIHFEGNGFPLTNTDMTVQYDTAVTLPWIKCSSSFGYTEAGWSTQKDTDRYEYSEKVKAYLRRGAKPLPGFDVYPKPQVGYGALCVRDSLPM